MAVNHQISCQVPSSGLYIDIGITGMMTVDSQIKAYSSIDIRVGFGEEDLSTDTADGREFLERGVIDRMKTDPSS